MKEQSVAITGNVKAACVTWNEHAFRTEGVNTPPYSKLEQPRNLNANAKALAQKTRQQRLAQTTPLK